MLRSKLGIVTCLLISLIFFGFIMTDRSNVELLKIAKEYKTYQQLINITTTVTDSSRYKWTISLCVKPPKDFDMGFHYKFDSSFISKADSSLSKHGNKLYKVFIKDYNSYIRNLEYVQPVGQTIVKETWNVAEAQYDSFNIGKEKFLNLNDGKFYTPTSISELFIMYKEEEKPTNDKGWVYGIVNVEDNLKQPAVLFAGSLSNCISCHKGTKYDRIFGTPKVPAIR